MRRERVREHPFVVREPAAQRVGDAEVRRPALDVRGGSVGALDLLEGARERQRVASELSAHGVREVLPLAAHTQREQLGDDRCQQPGDEPHDGEHQQERARLPLVAAPPAAPRPNHARRPVVHQGNGAHQGGQGGHEPNVEVFHVTQLVGNHPLELIAAAEVEQPACHGDV
ncbi:MAG: hypothetical protein AUH12_03965 [Gemmatimonadetes bacterium 13_2_20CM_69_8]|nr:MAG: hypothetical protein AUH12_03965 [Gemmatimonadetes bacterium 13_2_20CM_69_8]